MAKTRKIPKTLKIPKAKPPTLKDLLRELKASANPKKAAVLAGYFKTGKGEYGEGDRFLGLTVPQQRTIAKRYGQLSFADLETLIESPVHEHRFTCTEILQLKCAAAAKNPDVSVAAREHEAVVRWYLTHARRFNNWDLVDNTARDILGVYLYQKGNTALLDRLARSANVWERRIAIVSTHAFIQKGEFVDTVRISKLLISDEHDLIHKACGWMLREVGKQNKAHASGRKVLEEFLAQNGTEMPRTMLRYAIEHFSKTRREQYLQVAKK